MAGIVELGADPEVARWWRGLTHEHVLDKARGEDDGAIRCYEKVGFKRVGVLREYWLDGEGVWRDGVLLDLVASDLRATDAK